MKDRRIEVKDGGIYKISEYDGWFKVSRIHFKFLGNTYEPIGQTKKWSDVLDLVKSHSGKEIKTMR